MSWIDVGGLESEVNWSWVGVREEGLGFSESKDML